MTKQIKRSIAFIAANCVTTATVVLVTLKGIRVNESWQAGDSAWWSRVLLTFIVAQIAFRILVMIGLAIEIAVRGSKEEIDREDELDRAIDLKSTSIMFGIFTGFVITALATQAAGLPLQWLYIFLAAGFVVSGLIGDLISLFFYHRGY